MARRKSRWPKRRRGATLATKVKGYERTKNHPNGPRGRRPAPALGSRLSRVGPRPPFLRPAPARGRVGVGDRKQLKGRLSSALELSDGTAAADWKQLLVHDAARHAEALKPAEILPFRFPRLARWSLAAMGLAAGLGFVPEYRTKAHVQQQKDKVNVKEVGKQLADFTRKELVQRPPALPATQSAMELVAELGDQLTK